MPSLQRVERSKFWHCFLTLPDGRRTHRSTGTTDKKKAWAVCLKMAEAADLGRQGRLTEARARELIADCYAIANRDKMPSASVQDYLSAWLKRKELEVAGSSIAEYENTVMHLTKHMGDKITKHLDAITLGDITGFRDSLAKRLASGTVNKILKILRGAFKDAVRDGLTQANIFDRVKLVKAIKGQRRAFTLGELRRILEVATGEWRGMVLFGLYTGQRLGDIASLTWNQIDTAEREVHFITRKTGRNLNMPIAIPLMRHIETMPTGDKPGAPVFPDAHRVMQTSQTGTLSVQFGDLLAGAGLAPERTHQPTGKGRGVKREIGLSFHCLRHTATSLLKNAGVSDVVAREIIGHESEAVSRAYTHIDMSTLTAAMDKLPDLTGEAKP